ncbi:C40 family peptidase [Limosilactobacillus allomucosae]|uniref:LysM peptidoglycan-binding domain-containing protein n=1 Tax=Limosilactobacillus allomucosae TaxID=3142938 RepID=A0ABV0I384_9LACO
MVKRIKAQHQRHGRQWLLGTVSALSLLATAHAKADQVTVKDGDTVWDLANQYQTSVKAIEDANPHVKKISSSVDLIYAGQQLELSKNSTVSQASAVDSDSYTVKSGDTLSQISERLHVSLADLVSWNHLSNPDQLVIGQQLIVKGTAAASQTPASTSAAEASNTAVSVPATTNASSVSQAVVQTAPVVSSESTASDSAASINNAASQTSQADEPAAASSQAPAVTSAQNLNSSAEQSSTAESSETVSAESAAADTASADTVSSFDDQSAATAAASSASETAPVEQTAASSTASTATAISSADANSESASAEQPTQSAAASSVAESTSQQADSTSLVAADSSAASTQTATTDYSTAAASTSSSSTSEQASTNSTAVAADTTASTNSSSDLTTGSVVSLAVKLANANIPYVWGGASLSGMDCSGLVDYVFQNAEGISLPHYTVSLESCVSQHSVAEAQPGDILFWGNHGSTYHCAIYIGNNQYVAAPQPGQNVEIETISPYFMPSFAGTVIR